MRFGRRGTSLDVLVVSITSNHHSSVSVWHLLIYVSSAPVASPAWGVVRLNLSPQSFLAFSIRQ